jgi:Flp pilus assembly protein CpaB
MAVGTVPRTTSGLATAGILHRRRSLPNRRAMVGALLVIASLVGVFALRHGVEPASRTRYVVARHALSAGSRLQAADLALVAAGLPASAKPHAFTDPGAVVGRVVAVPVPAGELVEASAILPRGQVFSDRQMALTVDGAEAAAIEPGELVDVLVTHGTGDAARTDLVVGGAKVLRVGRVDATAIADRSGGAVVTVGVGTFAEVAALVHAIRTGQIDVVPGTSSDRFASGGSPAGIGPAPR